MKDTPIMQLRLGDAVAYQGAHYSVASVTVCRDAAAPWTRFGLSPVGQQPELGLVELRDALYAAESLTADWEAGAAAVQWEGAAYALSVQGRAPWEQEDRDGQRRFDRVGFRLYAGPEGVLLLDGEGHAGRFTWALRPLDREQLEVYPAAGA